eukprot:scaffold64387_cov64-Phaeocystis_antarctica.AAC.4
MESPSPAAPPSVPGTEGDHFDLGLLVLVIVSAVVSFICACCCVIKIHRYFMVCEIKRLMLQIGPRLSAEEIQQEAELAELERDEAERKKVAEARVEAAMKAAAAVITKAATENRVAENAAAFGLLQPLKALSLEADTLYRVLAAAVAYCDAQGAASFADLVERTSRLIAYPHDRRL